MQLGIPKNISVNFRISNRAVKKRDAKGVYREAIQEANFCFDCGSRRAE
jgi:hypothetical protein